MNVFVGLHKWARSQDENFTTEAFACVLEQLAKYDRNPLSTVLGRLFGVQLTADDCNEMMITTQKRSDDSQPDICIENDRMRGFVEVKVQSRVDWAQLKRHRENLDRNDSRGRRFLVLLTRDADTSSPQAEVDSSARWHEVAEWLRAEIPSMQPISAYLSEQFVQFLKQRGMTMEQVRKELIVGVRSFENLLRMLEHAITGAISEKRCLGGWKPTCNIDERGFYFGYNNEVKDYQYWCGVYPDRPGIVVFQAYYLGENAMSNAGESDWESRREGKRNVRYKEFDLNMESFFNRAVEEQKASVRKFIEDSLLFIEGRRSRC